jgi:hypothetical protein
VIGEVEMIDAASTWTPRRLALGACVTLAAALAGWSVAADRAEARFSLSGGCEIHENFCGGGGGGGAPSGTGWGVGGGSTGGGGTGGGSTGAGAGTASGGALPETGRGTTTCHLLGISFTCEYSDYRAPNGNNIRQCYWTEFGVRKHSIPCG